MTTSPADGPDEACGRCGGHLGHTAGENLIRGRIEWFIETWCTDCGLEVLACGRDMPTGAERAEILALTGLWQIRAADAASGVTVLKCLRETFGLTIAEAKQRRDTLASAGLSGTHGEMRLLRDRLADLGIAATVSET